MVLHGRLGAYVSFEDGRKDTWSERGALGGLTNTFGEIPPSDSLPEGRLFAGVYNGIVYSEDGAETWRPAQGAYGQARYIAYSFAHVADDAHPYGGILYAGVDDLEWDRDSTATIYRSEDGGTSWSRVHRFSPAALGLPNANRVVLASTPDGVLWAGVTDIETPSAGGQAGVATIVRSLDGGLTWDMAQDGYLGYELHALTLGPSGRLYAGSEVGLWRTTAPVVVTSEDGVSSKPALALTVSPNPARQLLTLDLADVASPSAEVIVVDAQGREVARRELAAGSNWRLDVRAWAPGVYHARIAGDRPFDGVAFTVVR
jgi:hypothetical protein